MPKTRSSDSGAQFGEDRHLKLLLNALSDYAISMLDPEGFVVTWYPGAAKVQGYHEAEVVGQHFSRFYTEADRQARVPEAALQAARQTGRHEIEGWRIRKDGSQFWAHTLLHPVRDETLGMIGFAEVTRDISHRRETRQALAESEQRFRMFVEGVVDYAIYMLDPSGVVTYWNAGAERIKGYTAAEIVGQHFSRFFPREDRAAGLPLRALNTARREGRYENEGWRIRKDGSRFWAAVALDAIRGDNGELLGFAEITRDITERQMAQEALQQSERQFRLLVSSVTDYAVYMLDPNGIVTSWNAGAAKIKGYQASEIIGQHYSRFHTDHDRAAGIPSQALHTAAQEGHHETDGWRVRKDGSLFWANVVIDAIRDENGALVGFAKITRDITERRAAQIALQKTQEQLAHAQKMEALGKMTGGVAHDFNNLLMIVSGHAGLLKRLVADNPKGLRGVEAIELAAQRGKNLTRRLLAFSRRRHLKPEPIDLGTRVDMFRSMLASSLTTKVELVTHVGDAWPIDVDVGEFELALVNLVLNARDAMPDGGIVTINAENITLQPGELDLELGGDFVAVTVADTGIGIPDDILPMVFDPFFTTKPVDQGTGLGLSQVHGFANQSGGGVTINSKVGQGSNVTMYLPRAKRALAFADESPEVEAATGGRVLVVEDNPEVAYVSASLLEDLGYESTVASSGEAALTLLEEDTNFGLVFSDIVMAGMDGITLANTIRERLPDMPVLLTSGYNRQVESAQPNFPILRKPYQLAELSRAVGSTIGQRPVPQDDPKLVHFLDAKRSRMLKGEQR